MKEKRKKKKTLTVRKKMKLKEVMAYCLVEIKRRVRYILYVYT